MDLNDVYYSSKTFSKYKNVIIHYTGNSFEAFYSNISCILTSCTTIFFEKKLLKHFLKSEYFYFSDTDLNNILNASILNLSDERNDILFNCFYDYLIENKSIVLNGFINFRLKPYMDFLDNVLSSVINDFVIQKEYYEFISLLKLYISSQDSSATCVHIVYSRFKTLLLNEDMSIMNFSSDKIFEAKFVSDISFSSNDYALNALLNILPSKIYIHLIDNVVDDFVTTLQLIFENRVCICTSCNICQLYRQSFYSHPQKDL